MKPAVGLVVKCPNCGEKGEVVTVDGGGALGVTRFTVSHHGAVPASCTMYFAGNDVEPWTGDELPRGQYGPTVDHGEG